MLRPTTTLLLLLLSSMVFFASAYHKLPQPLPTPSSSSSPAPSKAAAPAPAPAPAPASRTNGLLARRNFLSHCQTGAAAIAALAATATTQPAPSYALSTDEAPTAATTTTPPLPKSRLYQRFFTDQLQNPGLAGFGSPTLVYLPDFLFGEWNATMQLKSYTFPLGENFVPDNVRRSVKGVALNAPTSFLLRFYSTLPDTTENTLRVTLGEMPKSAIVPDRVFNTRSVIDSYYSYPACGEISYDMAKNPLRLKLDFSTIGPDFKPLPPRRQELFFNNLQFENVRDDLYICSEYVRTATLGPGSRVSVTDSETLSEYEVLPPVQGQQQSRVRGRQRVAIYLTPNPNSAEGAMYFDAGNKAVAIFEYVFEMERVGECVTTPKGVQQCITPDGAEPVFPKQQQR